MLRGVIHVPYEISACSAFAGRVAIDFSLQRDGLCAITDTKKIDTGDAYTGAFDSFRPSILAGEVTIVCIHLKEPLMTECLHCIECVESGRQPLTDVHDGLNVVRALEEASQSMCQYSA